MTVRTFHREIDIATNDKDMAAGCAHVGAHPDVPGLPVARHAMRIIRSGRQLLLEEDGEQARAHSCPATLLRNVRWRIRRRLAQEMSDAPILNAASLTHGGMRVLLVGPRGSGKTVLALKLMEAGLSFEGDHRVAVRSGGSIAYPQPVRIYRSSLELLPDFATRFHSRPPATDSSDHRYFGYDPASAGHVWRISEGPVDVVVVLAANFGGASSIRSISTARLIQHLMSNSRLGQGAKGEQAARLMTLAPGAHGYDLSHGNLGEAARLIVRVLERHAASPPARN